MKTKHGGYLAGFIMLVTVLSLSAEQATADPSSPTNQAILRQMITRYDRSIAFLERGEKEGWDAQRFSEEAVRYSHSGKNGSEHPSVCMGLSAPAQSGIWDESVPFPVSTLESLNACRSQRTLFQSMLNTEPADKAK